MRAKLNTNIFLIGFMGAGKSTVSRKIARICGCESVDVDFYIERMVGVKIREIFDEYGEDMFRKIESDALEEIAACDRPRIISCGGGIVVTPANVEIMKSNGFVVHLYSDAVSGAQRISDKSSRPLFRDMESATKRFKERLPLYEEAADVTIDTTNASSSKVTSCVISALSKSKHLEILEA